MQIESKCQRPGHKKNAASAYSAASAGANSANSIQSLTDEGFNQKKETENEKMWKIVETLRNNS